MKKKMIALLLTICMITGEKGMILQTSAAEVSHMGISTELSEENAVPTEDSAGNDNGVQESVKPEDSAYTGLEKPEESSESLGGTGNKNQEREIQKNFSEIDEEMQEEQSGENILTEEREIKSPADGKSEEEKEKIEVEEQTVQEEIEIEQPKSEEEGLLESGRGINLQGSDGVEFQEVIRGAGNYYEQEPNNSISESNAISLGTTVYGSLTDNDKEDYYKVTLPSAGALTLHIRSNDLAYVNAEVYYDETGENSVYWDTFEWNENLKLLDKTVKPYLEPGVYYIKISREEDYTGNYTCDVQFASSNTNDGEQNNSFDDAKNLNIGEAITGQISCNAQRDYYKINVGTVGKITVNMTSYMTYYGIILYDETQKELWYRKENYWNNNTGMRQDTYDLYLEPGIYYMKVISRDSYSFVYSGTYKMNLTFTATATSFTGDDNSAMNAKPITWNKTYKGQISINDEYDTYKFALAKGRNIPISVTANMRIYKIKMYDAAGKTVWEDKASYWTGWNETTKNRKDSYRVTLPAGTYYMEVGARKDWDDDWTGTYSFSLSAGELTSLKLNSKSVKLVKGKKYQLTPAMEPVNCKVTWKSDNPKVASVKSGKITAKGYGQATITCQAQDGSNKTASCKVTVVPAKAKISSAKSGKSHRKIKIKSQSGVTGFEVYTKTKRSSWKLYKTVKGSKNKSLKVKNKYYNSHSFRVRAYKQVGSKKYYGAYSKIL